MCYIDYIKRSITQWLLSKGTVWYWCLLTIKRSRFIYFFVNIFFALTENTGGVFFVLFCLFVNFWDYVLVVFKVPCICLYFSGCRDGRLAGGVGRELWLLLLLEHTDQWSVLGAATLSSWSGAKPGTLYQQVGDIKSIKQSVWKLCLFLTPDNCGYSAFIYSSSVNGNGTAHAGYCTEENAVSAATTTSAKETKVKACSICPQFNYSASFCFV